MPAFFDSTHLATMPATKRPASMGGTNYSNLFHSGLCAVSSRVRSMSAPSLNDSSQTSFSASSLGSYLRTNFWDDERDSAEPDATSSWAGVSSAAESDSYSESMSRESKCDEQDGWLINGVHFRIGLSRNLIRAKRNILPSEIDRLTSSPCPTASSFFIELSEGCSSTDSSPSFAQDDRGRSYLSLSTSPENTRPHPRSQPISIQTTSLPSSCSSMLARADKIGDDYWLNGLDLESPSECNQTRYDILPLSAVDADTCHLDGDDGDWRQFHADWMLDDDQVPSSPPFSPLST